MPGRRSLAVLTALAAATVPAGVVPAVAAGLAVSPARLTTVSSSTSVPTTTCTLSPVADTYASSALLNVNANFGTATSLAVRSDVLDNRRTYIRFDPSSCPGFSSPDVKSATLRLYLSTAPSSGRTYQVYRLTASWTETGLTWNTRPTEAATATDSTSAGTTSGVTLQWTVTADVQGFAAGTFPNFGWEVRDSAEGALLGVEGDFQSREGSGPPPQLVVTYYP